MDLSNAVKDSIRTFFRGTASRPAGLGARAPLQAAAGQATVVKLQTNKESQCLSRVCSACKSSYDVKESRFLTATYKPS
jgi:hypothetical protein